MKIDKAQQNSLEKQIKEYGKILGYRTLKGYLYSHMDDDFVTVIYKFVNSSRLFYMIMIKKFSYDDIFWDVINMSDNKDQPISLRVNGAFTSPSIIIAEGEISLSSDMCSVAGLLCNTVHTKVMEFRKHHNVNEYVIEHNEIPYSSTLKCLAYIDLCNPVLAVEVAQAAIKEGDVHGGFENEGKGFFEWILLRYNNMI